MCRTVRQRIGVAVAAIRVCFSRISPRPTGWLEAPFLALQLISLAAFGTIAFRDNQSNLLIGIDGSYIMTIVKQQHLWSTTLPGLTSNFFQSLGNVWIPLNAGLVPAYVFSFDSGSGLLDPVLCYTIVSIELFLAVYLLCRAITGNGAIAAMAGWGLVLLAMPIVGPPALYGIYGLAPNVATLTALVLLALLLFGDIGRGSTLRTLVCACLLLGVLFWLILLTPMFVVVVAPMLAVTGFCSIAGADTRAEQKAKLAAAAVLAVLLLASGMFHFLLGLYKNTAVYFFSREFLNTRQSLNEASIVFHWRNYGAAGPLLFWFALAGAVLAAIGAKGQARSLALGVLASMGLLVGTGMILKTFDFWRGPVPLYFEFFLWPLYAIYAALFLHFAISASIAAYERWSVRPSTNRSRYQGAPVQLALSVAFACAPWLLLATPHGRPPAGAREMHYPPALTPIVESLRTSIGLTPGAAFQGRVATFTGLLIPRPITWFDLHTVDYEIAKQFGNDHRTIGLWFYDIPTLFEYNQFISPAFYRITRDILGREGDQHIRSVVTLRKVEKRLLRLFGVRYVITDAPLDIGARLVTVLPDAREARLYLYEIDGANIGNFSPTIHRPYVAAGEVLAALRGTEFDGTREVFSETALPAGLVAASSSSLIVEAGRLRISARSAGRSVIVLPVEYSHCLELRTTVPGAEGPVLFRANLIQAGILFSGSLEATLSYFTGPFRNSACRVEDARDMERLNIREASAHR